LRRRNFSLVIDGARIPCEDGAVRRFVLLSLLGIAALLLGSLAFIQWLGGRDPAGPAPLPESVASPAAPRPEVVVPPPASEVAPAMEKFLNPPPVAVPPPAAPPPTVDLARDVPALQAHVSNRCGAMQLRLGDEMRKEGQQMTGQALLLFQVEPMSGKIKLGSSTLQSPGNIRPSLVACAQWALNGQVFDAPGVMPGKRFTVQVVLGMRPE